MRGLVGLPHVARVNSFSKSHGLSGARVAALALHPDQADRLFDLDPEAPVSGVSLALLRAALGAPELFTEVQAEVRRLRDVFGTLVEQALPGWRARPSGGNFVTFDVPEPALAASAFAFLHKHGYVTRDLSELPGLPAALRIAVSDEETVHRVTALLAEWRREQG